MMHKSINLWLASHPMFDDNYRVTPQLRPLYYEDVSIGLKISTIFEFAKKENIVAKHVSTKRCLYEVTFGQARTQSKGIKTRNQYVQEQMELGEQILSIVSHQNQRDFFNRFDITLGQILEKGLNTPPEISKNNFQIRLYFYWGETTFIWSDPSTPYIKKTFTTDNSQGFNKTYKKALTHHPQIKQNLQTFKMRLGPLTQTFQVGEIRMQIVVSVHQLETEIQLSEDDDMVREVAYQPDYFIGQDENQGYFFRRIDEIDEIDGMDEEL